MKGFMRYELKNGVEYASVYTARRVEGRKINEVKYLGKVIDKTNGIFVNRKRGVFSFSIEAGYGEDVPEVSIADPRIERMILDFGDSFFIGKILEECGMEDVLRRVFPGRIQSLLALLMFKIAGNHSNSHAQDWWEGSYARVLFPKAKLQSQRISELLRELGEEEFQRSFFAAYLSSMRTERPKHSVLIDSTGLPNDIHFPLTAVNTHNGVTSQEVRLILVLDKTTKKPLFFRYVAGNIVDVTTLRTTIDELKLLGVEVDFAILDAGYYCEDNIMELQESHISYLTRLRPNLTLYKELVREHVDDLEHAKYMTKYRDRLIHIKRVEVSLFDATAYAYIAMDFDRRCDEIKKYAVAALDDKNITDLEIDAVIKSKGFFAMISSEAIDPKEILPLYYTRQAIEQVFDFAKNSVDLIPLRVHGEEAFRGHLMLSFIASVVFIAFNQRLDGTRFNAGGAAHVLRNLKCKVYDKSALVLEPNKKMNDIAKHLKIKIPRVIDL